MSNRNFGLDLARAIAISMVFLAHGISAFASLGIGVDLFFVLSGFLVGRIYLRSNPTQNSSPWRFWQARWWRTLPPYYAALGVTVLLSLVFSSSAHGLRWYYIFFLQNYLGIQGLGVTWSLCVEEHFYLALPLIGIWLRLVGRRSLLWLLPMLALVPQGCRLWSIFHGDLPPRWYWMTHYHCDGLILGVYLAYLFLDHPSIWTRIRPLALALSAVPIILLTALQIHYTASLKLHGAIFLYYALGFAGWVRIAYDLKWHPVAAHGKLVKWGIHGLALCSYSLYLLHTVLLIDIRLLITNWPRGWFKSVFVLLCTLLLSLLFYLLVERPAIQTRDRYLQGRKEKQAPALQSEVS